MTRPLNSTENRSTSHTPTDRASAISGGPQPQSSTSRTNRVWQNVADQPERQVRRSHGGGLHGRAMTNAARHQQNNPADPSSFGPGASNEQEQGIARPSPSRTRPTTESLEHVGQSVNSFGEAMMLAMRNRSRNAESASTDDETYIPHNPGR